MRKKKGIMYYAISLYNNVLFYSLKFVQVMIIKLLILMSYSANIETEEHNFESIGNETTYKQNNRA